MTSVLDHLEIAEAVKPKITRPESDVGSELVAKGDDGLGMVAEPAR